ncbi:hypothetical protein D3C76_982530 [compost metagenome]
MAVTVGQQFIGTLGGRVQRNRVIDRIFDAKRQAAVAAIDRTARGIDQVPGAMVPTGFQHIEEAHQVRLGVHIRLVQRITHAGLGGQVHHFAESVLAEQVQQCRLVDDVHFPEAKARQRLKRL